MIRVDEIYQHTFWPFIKHNIPSTRMLCCNRDGLSIYDSDKLDFNYIVFHDQCPIDSEFQLFDQVIEKTKDCFHNACLTGQNTTLDEFLRGPKLVRPHYRAIITSEKNSATLELVKEKYNWSSYYYFYHGWAALDRLRGYNMTFVLPELSDRSISVGVGNCTHSLAQLINEPNTGQRHYLTDKIFKPISMQTPFILDSTAGSLAYLKSYGFKTFDSIWDESYDSELDDIKRHNKIAALVKELNILPAATLQEMFTSAAEIIKHNYTHFYNGGFEQILQTELNCMLDTLVQDLNPVRINFCYDSIIDGKGYPNLAKWAARPFTKEWRQFDSHWPRTVPLRLLMYLDSAGINYGTYTVADAPVGSWYPIALGWFDFDCDYISLMSEELKDRVRNKEIKLLFYYHEGDNPMRIRSRLGKLCWLGKLPADCFIFVSANSAAKDINQCIYFQEHESFFRYVNRKQTIVDQPEPTYDFTLLNRTHKWWRASCTADLLRNDILKNSLWSYDTNCSIGEDPKNNPLELDSEPGWRSAVNQFVANGPYSCDTLTSNQQNDHHVVNLELYQKSFFHIVAETHFDADQSGGTFITEKTWKCIKYGQPFIVLGPAGTLKALRESGYKVFDSVLDNTYDTIEHNTKRWIAVRKLLIQVQQNAQELYEKCRADVEWNQKMFAERQIPPLNNLLEKLK